jgi:Zn-dependent protease with chaperone function
MGFWWRSDSLGSALFDIPIDYVEGSPSNAATGFRNRPSRLACGLREEHRHQHRPSPFRSSNCSRSRSRARRDRGRSTRRRARFPLLVLANVIAPMYIAPLFNKFTPIEGDLRNAKSALSPARYGAGDATLLRVDMSRQTEKANAYVTGLFGSKRIVIGDTLLDHFEPRETLFVVAHELGHYVYGDVWRGVGLGTAPPPSSSSAAGDRGTARRSLGTTAGLARLFFAMSLLGTLAGPVLSAFSRARERAADGFAIEATQDGGAGAAAFTRLRERNHAEDEQPKWMELLFSSHPSLRSRIERLEAARRPWRRSFAASSDQRLEIEAGPRSSIVSAFHADLRDRHEARCGTVNDTFLILAVAREFEETGHGRSGALIERRDRALLAFKLVAQFRNHAAAAPSVSVSGTLRMLMVVIFVQFFASSPSRTKCSSRRDLSLGPSRFGEMRGAERLGELQIRRWSLASAGEASKARRKTEECVAKHPAVIRASISFHIRARSRPSSPCGRESDLVLRRGGSGASDASRPRRRRPGSAPNATASEKVGHDVGDRRAHHGQTAARYSGVFVGEIDAVAAFRANGSSATSKPAMKAGNWP